MEFILVVLTLLCSFVRTSLSECPKPYSKCNLGKPGHLNVHIVSHTHLDLGWVKTVEEYYNGTKAFSYEPSVKNIIDSVVSELKYNPERKFVFVEIGFFWMWWNNQNRETKTLVHSLVEQGRLEFLLGAWSMNDEGTPYYTDIIDQQSLGLKFIKEIFGDCARPRSAWQIDPFGHSREQASLFSQFGFDGLFLGRVDYQDFEDRGRRRAREMLWQASRNLKSSQIFTSILPNVYWAPKGFCWEMNCYDESIMDDVGTQMTNVDRRVAQFMQVVKEQSKKYKNSHLIMTFGNDFTYSNSRRWFDNIDKLIKHVNARQDELKVNVFYSTPECYQYAINREETDLEVKYDDFFPYADQISRFWTGYFTSRPALKYNVRQTSSFLQSARHLIALGDIDEAINAESIGVLERAMGILQHHDAISGTEKQYVANDYSAKLAKGVEKTLSAVNEAVKSILNRNFNKNLIEPLIHCPLLNITECLPIENEDRFSVLVYNPLPRKTQTWITVPIVGLNNEVVDVESEKGIVSDTAPVYRDIELVSERKAQANYRLLFKADLPPMGFKVFRVQKNKQLNEIGLRPVSNDALKSSSFSLKNEKIGLRFDQQGNLIGVENFESGISTAIKQGLCYYVSEHTYSGAYIFRPKSKPNCLGVREYSIGNSKRLTEVHQVYNDWLSQTIRLYEGAQHVDFEWQVGPIDINDEMGKDVIMMFSSDLTSNSTFYTDSNGREILARRRDYRPTWKLFQTDSISGNYYPVNSRIFLRDETNESINSKRRQMTLLSDRSQGGSSLTDGSLEVMLHRRQLYDDGLGVNEALNETGTNQKGLVVRGVTSLILDTVEKSARIHRQLAHEINNKPLVTFSINDEANIRPLSGFSALSHELPRNLHVLTFASEYSMSGKPLTANSILVRIEHFYEKDEDSELSQPVTVNLKEAFGKAFNFVGVEELALGANIKVSELDERLKWRADVNENYLNNPFEYNVRRQNSNESNDPFTFTFYPMQIRTFRLIFLPKYM